MAERFILHIPGHDPIECGPPAKFIPEQVVCSMKFLYERDGKFHFETLTGEIVCSGFEFPEGTKLVEGETYKGKYMTYKYDPT